MKACASGRGYATCAECTEIQNFKERPKLYNFILRAFGFIFRTDRIGNLARIRAVGLAKFKAEQLMDTGP